jgi:hypothetical protein
MTLAELTALWWNRNAIDKLAEELGQGDKDKLHRIHGTNEPWTGTNVSSGCIRLTNDDITDFYNRTPVASTTRPQSFDRSIKTTRDPITRRWNFQTANRSSDLASDRPEGRCSSASGGSRRCPGPATSGLRLAAKCSNRKGLDLRKQIGALLLPLFIAEVLR